MEFISKNSIVELSNPGVVSRHTHETSEQIWYATKGEGMLLLADEKEQLFAAGDVVRFADGDVHGLRNDGREEFVYISVTTPPIHLGYAYKEVK